LYPSIGIVNRRYESRRSIVNIDEIYREVFQRYPNSIVSVTYFEDLTVLQQIQYMMEHDIIVSPHGAQLVNLIYMPTYEGCSNIMEIFPENYLFGIFFGSLARAGGIRHSSMYVSANPPPITDQFQYVSDLDQREVEFCLPLELVIDAVDNMVTNWSKCCSEYHSNNSNKKP
jgi:capsular polysaccharide biosynthesis protein